MAIDYNPENCVISVGVSDYDRSLGWYRDVLGFELEYELKDYGWCELKTPFGFNIGLGQTETVAHGNITPTFGVHDIDAAIASLREQDVTVEDWHEIPSMVRLSTFYDDMKGQQEMQEQVIFLLSQRREAEATDKLMDIARREQNRELRKNAIFWLGQKKDPRVVQFLMELINK